MGYMHINNLYKDQRILAFKEVYALEKVHGTSAHLNWELVNGGLSYFSGGARYEHFRSLFDHESMTKAFQDLGFSSCVVYGEAYGGKVNGQAWRYGKELRFVAFDVKVNDHWLAVPQAEEVVQKLGLEFVSYSLVHTDIETLDHHRDQWSSQAIRLGLGDHPREGIVLRPPFEVTLNNGERLIAKHKRDDERETKGPRKIIDPKDLEVLVAAEAIAEEWVTPTRLQHVLDKLGGVGIEQTGVVVTAMVEDVLREGAGELVDSKEARRAIGKKAAAMFKHHLQNALHQEQA